MGSYCIYVVSFLCCFARSVLDAFKLVTVSDALVDSSLSPIDGLPPSPSISIPFDSSSFKLKDFEKIVQSRRNASAPGINMIPYKVYKKCPQLMSFLFKRSCCPEAGTWQQLLV